MSHQETVKVVLPDWLKLLKWPGIIVACGAAIWSIWIIPLKVRDWADSRWMPRSELNIELEPMKKDIEAIKDDAAYTRRRIDRVLETRASLQSDDRFTRRPTHTSNPNP